MLKRVRWLLVPLVLVFLSGAAAADTLEALEKDVIEYCQEMRKNRDYFYSRDVGTCEVYKSWLYRQRAYEQFLVFQGRLDQLKTEEEFRAERLQELLNHWIE